MWWPFARVTRPDNWAGSIARTATGVVAVLVLLTALLMRLPSAVVALTAGVPELGRAVLALGGLWIVGWLRIGIYSRLPGAPYLFFRTLVYLERGKRFRVKLRRIIDIQVDVRPPPVREMFIIELDDGSIHDLCPVHWQGAPQLYAAIARHLGARPLADEDDEPSGALAAESRAPDPSA